LPTPILSLNAMRTFPILRPALVAIIIAALSGGASAQLSGQKVYETSCAACHSTGVANAPRFGDKASWAKLIEEPQAQLTAHGWLGVRAMPPVGGNAKLSLEEFSRSVAFMARAAGARWPDPDAKMLGQIKDEVIKRIEDVRRSGAKLP